MDEIRWERLPTVTPSVKANASSLLRHGTRVIRVTTNGLEVSPGGLFIGHWMQ
jgi:hypothetical protein